jgi:hypothetical protein
MRCRNEWDGVKTGSSLLLGSVRGEPVYCPGGVRHIGGENLVRALVWNVGTCPLMRREKHEWEAPISVRVPMRGNRGGVARSSDEVSVMGMERKSYIVRL